MSVAVAAATAQQFDELVGRGLARVAEDTAVVKLCDVDGDGHPDLVFGVVDLYPGRPLQLLLGSADGLFSIAAAGAMPTAPCLPAALVCADFDADGDVDVFVANRDFVQDRLFANDGTGRFSDVTVRLPASGDDGRAAAAADVDRDGDLDLIVANALGPDRLLLNDGAGSFVPGPMLPDLPGDDPTSVAFVDADRDGAVDVVIGNARGQNRYWHNDGVGGFADRTAAVLPVDLDITTSVVVADLDADGALDLVIGNRRTPERVYRNDGTGRFITDPTWSPFASGETIALEVVDADADGDTDVVAARFGGPNVLLVNDGTGSLRAAARPWLEQSDHTNTVSVADVDGDGDIDIVFGNGRSTFAPGHKQLLLNDGSGSFVSATAVAWPAPSADSHALVVADFDGDGHPDVAVAAGSAVETWGGDGYGGLGARTIVPTGVQPDFVQALAAADVDADGDVDLVVGTSSSNVLLLNDGSGAFGFAAPGAMSPGAGDTRAVALVDVDADGDFDVVEGNAGSSPQFAQQNRLLLNDGTGRFVDATSTRLPSHPDFTFGIAAADVDRDGDFDLLFANWSVIVPTAPRQPNRLLLNDGTGRFADAPAGRLPVDDDPTAVVVCGDVDGDGDVDIVTGNVGARNRLYRNDGAGTFTEDPTAIPPRADATRAAVLADYDSDGDLDVAFGNDSVRNGLLRNDGAAGFVDLSATAWDGLRESTAAIALVDIDGDADLDALIVNRAGQIDRLLFCLVRQLDIPFLMRTGRTFSVEAYARPTPPGTRAHLWVALADAPRFQLPPFGDLRLDPNGLLDLGEATVSPATGRADFRFSMPLAPAFVGVPLYFQSLIFAPTALQAARLTNLERGVVGS